MIPRYLPIFIAPYTILLALPASARAQDGCRADSVSTARAESLLTNISDEVANPGSRGIRSMYARVRRAVEVAPLSHTRWKRILQVTRSLSRPDTAVALATLALRRWPRCAIGDSAVSQARAFLAVSPIPMSGTRWERRDAARYCEGAANVDSAYEIIRPDSASAVSLARRALGAEAVDWEVLEFRTIKAGSIVRLGIPEQRRGAALDGTQTLFVDPDRCVTKLWW